MTTLTLTSKSGTTFEITGSHDRVTAKAKGINLGGMRIVDEGKIEATCVQKIGGKTVRIGAEFGPAEWAQIQPLFEAVERRAEEIVASEIEYDKHVGRVYGTE